MAKLEGIIYKAFGNYVVLRGFAKIGELADVSYRPDAYQRKANDHHKRDIIRFLREGSYTYFPELILAYRADDFKGLVDRLQGIDEIEWDAEAYVSGLKVLKERVPASGYRARHAFINVSQKVLPRIDGNHRLEPFDMENEWWDEFIGEKIPTDLKGDELRQWKDHKITSIKNDLIKKIVPFVIVISDAEDADKFEAGIFNNVNFKQLPLRQEKNLQNIQKFLSDSNELGEIHDLTMKLIAVVESGYFNGLPLFSDRGDNEIYRTVCFRILNLLYGKKLEITQSKKDITTKHTKTNEKLALVSKELDDLNVPEIQSSDSIESIEYFKKKNKLESKKAELEFAINKYENLIVTFKSFIRRSLVIDDICEAIQLIRPTYKIFNKSNGNIALLSALVYYKLFNELKYQAFVEWVINNNINEITTLDDLPIHTSDWLIDMFERVYTAKGMEVFISMHFGDDQSEMIYEKIEQTIKDFNIKRNLNIRLTPIRIDRTIAPHSFTISEEILKAIKNSSLIIADLSSGNMNVYHEIGYTMGLAEAQKLKPRIVLLYKENTVFNKEIDTPTDSFVGFNLRGLSQLRFKKYEELTTGLMKRLEKHFEE